MQQAVQRFQKYTQSEDFWKERQTKIFDFVKGYEALVASPKGNYNIDNYAFSKLSQL